MAHLGLSEITDELFTMELHYVVIASAVVDALLGTFYAVIAAVAYVQLREQKEGAQVPQLARAFARVRG